MLRVPLRGPLSYCANIKLKNAISLSLPDYTDVSKNRFTVVNIEMNTIINK